MPSDPTANDNHEPPTVTVSIADLAAELGIDEDAVLQRIAGILKRREEAPGGEDAE